jgi:hypothetical protein
MEWVVNATPRPLYPRERHPIPSYRTLGGPRGRSERVRKVLPPTKFDPRTVQPVDLFHPYKTQISVVNESTPIPVPARSRAWVCGCSLAAIVGSNPAGGMDVSCKCCMLSGRGLCVGLITLPEESYRVRCVCVIVKPR